MNHDRRRRRPGSARPPGRRIATIAAATALLAGMTAALPGTAAADTASLVDLSTQVYGIGTDPVPAATPLAYAIASTVGEETPAGRITTTITTPTGVRLLGAAGTGWACGAARLQTVSCVSNQTPDARAALDPLVVTAVSTAPIAAAAVAGASVQATDGVATTTADPASAAGNPTSPVVASVTPAVGPRSGHTPLTITGTGLDQATAVQIGTPAQLAAGNGTTLVECAAIAAPQCFTEKDGVLSISSMPTGGGDVSIRVLAMGAAGSGSYRYADIPDAPIATATPEPEGAQVTWTTPAAGSVPITGYTVTGTRDGTPVADLTRTVPADATSTRYDNLGPTSAYRFAVRATSSSGDSQPGSTPIAVPFTAPTAPSSVIAQPGLPLGNGEVELTWFAPTDDGASPLTGYRITPVRDGQELGTLEFDASSTSQTITGLDVGSSYQFLVSAGNAAGWSGNAAPSPAIEIPAAQSPYPVPLIVAANAPAGVAGDSYTWTPRLTGGTAPFTWAVTGGALPDGLSLDPDTGQLSGRPSAPGTFSPQVDVIDADGIASRETLTMTVREGAVPELVGPDIRHTLGSPITLTSTVRLRSSGAPALTGRMRFSAGHDSGAVVALGDAPVTNGAATLVTSVPYAGLWTVRAYYIGDDSVGSEESVVAHYVAPVAGSVLITGLRTSGPNGPTDQYVELTNVSGAPVPLTALSLFAGGGFIALPDILLAPGRLFLVTGPDYVPAGDAVPDVVVNDGLGTGELFLLNVFTYETPVDVAGPVQAGFPRIGPLPDLGQPAVDYAWIRPQQNGSYRNTGDNTVDFALVSADGAPVSGVTAMAGSASPQSSTSPWFHAGDLESTLLNPLASESVTPNRTITKQAGQPGGTIVSRRVITNRSTRTMDQVQLRLIDLSQANGLPGLTLPNGAATASLRGIAPTTPTATFTINNQQVTAQQLTPSGSGLNAVYSVPLPQGGLAPGQSVAVTLTFQADTGGQFRFRYLAEGQYAG